MPPLSSLSAGDIAQGVRAGTFSATEVIEACLARISAREPLVGAWEFLDPDLARRQALAVDEAAVKGSLCGVPIGVKDIMNTGDMPTGMGSPIYEGHRPAADAACVAALRAAGAVVPGKNVTCEFAGLTAGKTANPVDPRRTPGGSSSGSAAAVADLMVPVALGTQTGGSVLRPSSYCGVIGFKPSYGRIDLAGVFPAAPSLDTLGLHARSLDDIEGLLSVLAPGLAPSDGQREAPSIIGLCRTAMWDQAKPETRAAIEDAASRLSDEGAGIIELTLPQAVRDLNLLRPIINDRERSMTLQREWAEHRHLLSPQMQNTIRRGHEVPDADYKSALRLMNTYRADMTAIFSDVDFILTPAVDGEAPEGLEDTGDPKFQSLWTLLGTPAVSLPVFSGPSGLPVGIQLVAPCGHDADLIAVSRWVMERLS